MLKITKINFVDIKAVIMILEPIEELKKFNIFSDFTDVQLTFVRENGKQLDIPEKKVLLKQGATHTNIFLLLNFF